jgi:superfamily II DNA or RNA helicase
MQIARDSRVRLEFDRGTVTLTGCSEQAGFDLPGVLWDPRVQVYRAPGFRYTALKAALNRSGRTFHDHVCAAVEPPVARWEEVELRPYQAAALTSWELSNARGLVVLPTGSGKTRLALAAMARRRCRTLCLVPTRVLLEQWRTVLGQLYRGPIGQYGDGTRAVEAVTVATFASAFYHMASLGNRFDLLVVDEAHHFGTGAGDEALELCTAPARIGLTATPPTSHLHRTRLEELIGPEVYRQSVADLAGEYLAPLQVVSLRLDLTPLERREYAQEVAAYQPVVHQFFRYSPRATWQEFQGAAVRTDEGRRALAAWRRSRKLVAFTEAKQAAVARLLVELREARLLVFTGDNDTAYRVASEHCIMPITCDIGRAERREALERFRTGDLAVLVSAQVLNEGIDVPAAEAAILVGGRLGTREYVQRVGRTLRPAPGKQAVVYELVTRGTHEVRESLRKRQELGS